MSDPTMPNQQAFSAQEFGQQIAVTALTMAAGHYFGPAGYVIGGTLGTILFPPKKPKKPDPETEAGLNSVSEGNPVSITYGTDQVLSAYIYSAPLTNIDKGNAGYKYFNTLMLSHGKGECTVSRMWKNGEPYIFDNKISPVAAGREVIIYKGTEDQPIDPTLLADQPQAVPYRGNCTSMHRNMFLGFNNSTLPVIKAEIHRYPYSEDLKDANPRAYQRFADTKSYGGLPLKDIYGNVYLVTRTVVHVLDNDMQHVRDIDISSLNIPASREIGAYISYRYDAGYITIIWENQAQTKVFGVSFVPTISSIGVRTWVSEGVVWYVNYTAVDHGGSAVRRSHITANKYDEFLVYENASVVKIRKARVGRAWGEGTTVSTSMDLGVISVTCNDDRLFVLSGLGTKLYILDFDGNILDTETMAQWTDEIQALSGGRQVVGVNYNKEISHPIYEMLMRTYIYDESDQWITQSIPEIQLSPYFATGYDKEILPTYAGLHEGRDGTLFVGGTNESTNTFAIQIPMGANAAHILYDMMNTVKYISSSRINLPALEIVAQYCVDNRIPMNFTLDNKQNIAEVIRDILGHLLGQVYRDSTGKFKFYVSQDSDSSVATITEGHVLAATSTQSVLDENIVKFDLKDIQLCPNRLDVYFSNRFDAYKKNATFPIDVDLEQERDGEPTAEEIYFKYFSDPVTASRMAWRGYKTGRYNTTAYLTQLPFELRYLEIGNVFVADMPDQEFHGQRCRIISVDKLSLRSGGGLVIAFILDTEYLNSFEDIDFQPSLRKDTVPLPASVTRPIVFEEDALRNNGVTTLGITTIPFDANTTIADIYTADFEAGPYKFRKRLYKLPVVGELTGALDTRKFPKIEIDYAGYSNAFPDYTWPEQRQDESFCLIGTPSGTELSLGNMEFVNYKTAKEISGTLQKLTEVNRGNLYTINQAHPDEDLVVLVGFDDYFRFEVGNSAIGQKIFVKAVPGNVKGEMLDIDDIDSYSYTIHGVAAKASHVWELEIQQGGIGLGRIETAKVAATPNRTVTIQYGDTNKLGGPGRSSWEEWLQNEFIPGDIVNYVIYVYDASLNLIATHSLGSTAKVYAYTEAQNIADFSGFTTDFYLGVKPENAIGGLKDEWVEKKHILVIE